ncbi:MAG: hypothetical protein ACLSE4_10215 [Clostridium sp.]
MYYLVVAAATMLMTAGCQSKYEKIEVPGAIVESAAEEQKAEISENKAELIHRICSCHGSTG